MITQESQAQKYWDRTRVQFGAGSFGDWYEEVLTLIRGLNGGTLPNAFVNAPSIANEEAPQDVQTSGNQTDRIEPYIL
jgi:hypothetical protein